MGREGRAVGRWARAGLTGVAAVIMATPAALAAPAAADASGDVVRDLTIEIELDADGTAHVTETYQWDFGAREGLGFIRSVGIYDDWPHDPDLRRAYDLGEPRVTSVSGAPDEVWTEERGADVEFHIGAPDGSDDTRTGVQTYELSYTLDGALNAIRDEEDVPDQDELYWNVTGHDWHVPLERVTTTVTGPAGVTDVACWEGPEGSDQACRAMDDDGAQATFVSGPLEPGQGQTIAVAFPAGTFDDIEPILVADPGSGPGSGGGPPGFFRDLAGTGLRIAASALGGAGVALTLLALLRLRSGRDEHFAGLTPGVLPPLQQVPAHPVSKLRSEPAPTVRFAPPEGLTPAEAGFLLSKRDEPEHLAATLVSFATRGLITITEARTDARGRPDDWRLDLTETGRRALSDPVGAGLTEHEMVLIRGLFPLAGHAAAGMPRGHQAPARAPGGLALQSPGTTSVSGLRHGFGEHARRARQAMHRRIASLGLFRRDPAGKAPARVPLPMRIFMTLFLIVWLSVFGGIAVPILVLFSGAVLPWPVAAGVLALLLTGIGWLVLRRLTWSRGYPRTATGRALYEQIRGFELYLKTAEAEQIRFEEGRDVFAAYLPWAMVFGVAERWAAIFEQLHAQGRYHADTSFYSGVGRATALSGVGAGLSRLSSSTSSAVRTTSGGGAGGSGFSGGSRGGRGGGRSGGGGGRGGGRGR